MNELTIPQPAPMAKDLDLEVIKHRQYWDGPLSMFVRYNGKVCYADYCDEVSWYWNKFGEGIEDEDEYDALFDRWDDAQIWYREYDIHQLTVLDRVLEWLESCCFRLARRLENLAGKKHETWCRKLCRRVWPYLGKGSLHERFIKRPVVGKFCL